jgi:hypothetical protein
MRDRGYTTLVLLLFSVHRVPWSRLELAATASDIALEEIVVLLHRAADEPATRKFPPASNAA